MANAQAEMWSIDLDAMARRLMLVVAVNSMMRTVCILAGIVSALPVTMLTKIVILHIPAVGLGITKIAVACVTV